MAEHPGLRKEIADYLRRFDYDIKASFLGRRSSIACTFGVVPAVTAGLRPPVGAVTAVIVR
jgi:hypothetical protein